MAGFTIHAVPAAHNELEQDQQGRHKFLGYVVEAGPWTIYHSGDTLRYPGMEDWLTRRSLDVALLREDPSRANTHDDGGNPLVFYLHPELARLTEMIQLLAAHGADFHARNKDGQTLLDRALARGWTDFANTLREYGARSVSD